MPFLFIGTQSMKREAIFLSLSHSGEICVLEEHFLQKNGSLFMCQGQFSCLCLLLARALHNFILYFSTQASYGGYLVHLVIEWPCRAHNLQHTPLEVVGTFCKIPSFFYWFARRFFIIIMSCHQHWYPWPPIATIVYRLWQVFRSTSRILT